MSTTTTKFFNPLVAITLYDHLPGHVHAGLHHVPRTAFDLVEAEEKCAPDDPAPLYFKTITAANVEITFYTREPPAPAEPQQPECICDRQGPDGGLACYCEAHPGQQRSVLALA